MFKNIGYYFKWFYQFWREVKFKMFVILFLTIASVVVKTVYPIFLKYIIDAIEFKEDISKVYTIIYWFAGFIIIHGAILHILPMFRAHLNVLFAAMIRNRYFVKLTAKNFSFFQKFRTGDLLTRLSSDIDGSWENTAWFSCSGIFRPIESVLVLSFTLGVMFSYSVTLSIASFLPIPFLIFVVAKAENRLMKYADEKQVAISKANNVLENLFSGIRVIKSTMSEQDQIIRYQAAVEDRKLKEKRFLKMNEQFHFFSMLINHLGSVIVIFYGSYQVISGSITLGTLLMFIIYIQRLIEPLWSLSWFYASSIQVFKYVDRLIEIDEEDVVNRDKDNNIKIESFKKIELKKVCFGFNERGKESILKDISFDINRGEIVAIVGKIGTGKSTLLEIIAGNYPAKSGEVLFNGYKIEKIPLSELYKVLGYVKQENLLFSESIRDNLVLGDSFSNDEIERSLKLSLMHEELKQFPDGVDTKLGQRGVSLSGGQKQRVSIARSLIRQPEILLLDDITAAMDANTENLFWKGLRRDMKNTACIVVTHRMATAKKADRIIVIDNGGIVQNGSYPSLIAKDGAFSQLMSSGEI